MRRREGLALVVVLVFALLLTSQIATFLRRATVDSMVARHRDAGAEAEALARGGVRLAIALLLEDRLEEEASQFRVESPLDVWARASGIEVPAESDAALRLQIRDAGSRFNLSALLDGEGAPRKGAELLLSTVLDKLIREMPAQREGAAYDARELARNLLDFIDKDDVRVSGGSEDSYYEGQDPPYAAANRPLLSLDELRMVEGFDGPLVEALRPYATVYPLGRADGINPNTAPPHVLALLYHGVGEDLRLASEDTVRRLLKLREKGELLCADQVDQPDCVPIGEVVPGEIQPPPSFSTDTFLVESEARVGEVRRVIETVVDRSDPSAPQLLAWRVR